MDAVGRALLEQDDPSVFRIKDVDFNFVVEGSSLQELGARAHATAKAFYGEIPFVIRGLRVEECLDDRGGFLASVSAELKEWR